MSNLLELFGKGLETSLLSLILPRSTPLTPEQVSFLKSQVEADPSHTANVLRLAIHHIQSAAHDRAISLLEGILGQDKTHLDAHLAMAYMYSSASKLDAAIDQLNKAYKYHKKDSRVFFALGCCYERQGDIKQAMNYYKKGISARPYLARNMYRLAAISLYLRQYDHAIDYCRKLVEQNPNNICNYLFLGQLFLITGQYDKAIDTYEKGLTIEPDNFELHDDQVEKLVQAGQIPQAIERIHEIIDQQGDFPDSYVRLGDLYSRQNDDDAAVSNYSRALELYPGYLEAAVKLGTQHMRMMRYYHAAQQFNQAIEINDQLIATYSGLALAQHLAGDDDVAIETLELAGAIEPNTNLLFTEVNRLQFKLSQSQKSAESFVSEYGNNDQNEIKPADIINIQIRRYQQALKEKPDQASLNYRYGLLLQGNGQTSQAADYYKRAVAANPSFLKARIKLSLTYLEDGQYDLALTNLKDAFYLDKEYLELHYKLALMYCDKIQFALSVEQIASEATSPQEAQNVHNNLMLALQNMALVDRAAANWQAVCELEPQSSLAFLSQRQLVKLKPHIL